MGDIVRYYDTAKPLLDTVNKMAPPGTATNADEQKKILSTIANTYSAEGQSFKDNLSNTLSNQVDKYIEISHRLNDYNEIYNTNKYIQKELGSDNQRIGDVNNKLKNRIFISKQKSQLYRYDIRKYRFMTSILLSSMFLLLILLSMSASNLAGTLSGGKFYTIVGITALIYTCVLVALVINNSYRSPLDWDKSYWLSVKRPSYD
jgi:ABC-type multidrug transport system fused ATPase/permease subunit